MSDANDEKTATCNESSQSQVEKCKRQSKNWSEVWKHFTKLEVVPNKIPTCQCNHCKMILSCDSKSGTTHLHCHIEKSCSSFKDARGKQQLLQFNKGNGAFDSLDNFST